MNPFDPILSPPAIYGQVVAGQAAAARLELKELAREMKKRTFDVAVKLTEAKRNNWPRAWGYNSLEDYACQELDIGASKSLYLVRLVEVCEAVGLQRNDYEPAGVAKLRVITRLEPDGNYFNKETEENEEMAEHIVRLITDAPDMTIKQVEKEVKRLQGLDGEDELVPRTIVFKRSTWEHVIERAVERVRRHLGSAGKDSSGKAVEYSMGVCLEEICANFLADPNFAPEPLPLPVEDNNGDTPLEVPEELQI